ncbi:MAG: DUF2652 domain-containing protein [Gemmatimonadetes bacterium]|nr:DUF2652 domain-containing protein [Gemmatimonadota bacterium]
MTLDVSGGYMDPAIQSGYVVLVDLSGYTQFVARSELDHAQRILAELLALLRRRLTPTLRLAEIEGDALFLYAPGYRVLRGETLLELIESTYVQFRDRKRMMQRATTCPCEACHAMPRLDLKFIAHCGDYVLQDLTGAVKPFGSCVNLAHRLLKNTVTEETGWPAYALFTGLALERMGIRPEGMYTDCVAYEHLGECEIGVIDLERRYNELTAERSAFVGAEDAHFTLRRRYAAPPERLWEYLNEPQLRAQWQLGSDWTERQRPGGRTGPGAHSHCANSGLIEEVLDWRPFRYFTVRMKRGFIRFLLTAELTAEDDGTSVNWSVVLEGGAPPALRAYACRLLMTRVFRVPASFDRLDALVATGEGMAVGAQA